MSYDAVKIALAAHTALLQRIEKSLNEILLIIDKYRRDEPYTHLGKGNNVNWLPSSPIDSNAPQGLMEKQ